MLEAVITGVFAGVTIAIFESIKNLIATRRKTRQDDNAKSME